MTKQKKSPEISIIVPVYKVEKYLNECIDSILAQTFTDFEMILVTQDGQIYLTEGIEDQFTLSSDFGNMDTHVIERDEQ